MTDNPIANLSPPPRTCPSIMSFAGINDRAHVLTNALRRRPACGFGWRDRVNLFKHAAHANEVVIEDFFGRIKQLKYAFVAHGVIDVCTFFTSDDDISVAQYSKLLRCVSLLDLKTLADLVDGQLAVSQGIKNRYSQGVSQGFEKLCLEFTELLSHSTPLFFAIVRLEICTSAHP